MGTQLPLLLMGRAPQFSTSVHCGQTAGWTKMPLGMEVGGLGPGDFVFDGDPATPEKRAHPHPIFGSCLLWPNGWIDQDETWHESRLRPRHIVLDGDPAPPKEAQPPIFGPCPLWSNGWMDQDATGYTGRPRPRQHCIR